MTVEGYDKQLQRDFYNRLAEQEQRKEDMRREGRSMGKIMAMLNKIADAEYEKEHQGGYCPRCFTLRTYAGRCVNGCDD